MPHYSAFDPQNSVQFYRHDLMEWRRRVLGISCAKIARETGIFESTVRSVFRGRATGKQVYPVAKVLGLDWEKVHNFDLQESEFHLAVINGNGSHLAR